MGIERLDQAKHMLRYIPLTTRAMMKAAELWAEVRNRGLPTTDHRALDVDVILAAQVVTTFTAKDAPVVATDNIAHIARFVPAKRWNDINTPADH